MAKKSKGTALLPSEEQVVTLPMDNGQCEEARVSTEEIAEIYRNMEDRKLSDVFCQACSEEMKPEQARKSATGLIMCRPCNMLNQTGATQDEIDQALEEDFPGYLASLN